jgi:hypothetical protein
MLHLFSSTAGFLDSPRRVAEQLDLFRYTYPSLLQFIRIAYSLALQTLTRAHEPTSIRGEARLKPLSAACTASARSRWKNGVPAAKLVAIDLDTGLE